MKETTIMIGSRGAIMLTKAIKSKYNLSQGGYHISFRY